MYSQMQAPHLDCEDDTFSDSSDDAQRPPVKNRHIMWFGIALVGTIACSLAVFSMYPNKTAEAAETTTATEDDFLQHFDTEILEKPATVPNFMTSRALAQIGSTSFNIACDTDQPICNPEVVFASEMQKVLKTMKSTFPDLYDAFNNVTMNQSQMEFVLRLLPLAQNPKVLAVGEVVAKTAKHWKKSGRATLNAKVQEALFKYSEEHGMDGVPQTISKRQLTNSSLPYNLIVSQRMLKLLGEDSESDSNDTRRLWNVGDTFNAVGKFLGYGSPPESRRRRTIVLPTDGDAEIAGHTVKMVDGVAYHNEDGKFDMKFVPGANGPHGIMHNIKVVSVYVVGPVVAWIVVYMLEIGNYMHWFNLPLLLKQIWMWWDGIYYSTVCVTIVGCPFAFLLYWLDAFLLFAHDRYNLKNLPWDFMLKNLPGLKYGENHQNGVTTVKKVAHDGKKSWKLGEGRRLDNVAGVDPLIAA